MPESTSLRLHDDSAMFREAVNFTASKTGFNARLIEKDYFCTILLAYLIPHGEHQLVFKGGTCLAKVHAGFYRLSEDLDFMISIPVNSGRNVRQQAIAGIKRAVADVASHVPVFTTVEPIHGANYSTQYNGSIGYISPVTGDSETIKIKVSVREPLMLPAGRASVRTLLLDPIGGQAIVPPVAVACISMLEAMAEKFRAALSRQDVAIRDFFDIDYAARHLGLDTNDAPLTDLVRRKLAGPGNLYIDIGAERITAMRRQLNTRLRMVLRDRDFEAFDLDRAIGLVFAMAERL
jgi:predicted nucleotidyltransferase component of viral defense system